jgi:type VII secretion integral membrane protein EccD
LMLTSSTTQLTAPRFDDVAEAISVSLATAVRPWNQHTARLVSALAASWLAGAGAAVLIRTAFAGNDVRRTGSAWVASAVGVIALLAALLAYRVFRDMTAGLTLGLVATGFAALAGLLAIPGALGAPHALLATAAAAAAAAALRVIGRGAAVFTALCCLAAVAATAAVVATLSAVPLSVVGAGCAAISLVLVEASPPMSIMLAGLSPQLESEHRLNAKAIRANSWLTSLVVAFSAAAALGALGAAAGPYTAGAPRSVGLVFATLTGCALLLRARSQHDPARTVALFAGGIATLSGTLVIAAAAYPWDTPYLAAASTMLAGVTLWLGFITHAMALSPIARRSVELLEYLALALIVPLACWLCGLYSTARGLNLL